MSETPALIPLRHSEFALLIRASQGQREPLSIAFGTGGVALQTQKTPWAVPLVRAWRGETFDAGGGI